MTVSVTADIFADDASRIGVLDSAVELDGEPDFGAKRIGSCPGDGCDMRCGTRIDKTKTWEHTSDEE